MTFRQLFLIAAIVVFILAALFAFGLGAVGLTTVVGLIAVGLVLYATTAVVP